MRSLSPFSKLTLKARFFLTTLIFLSGILIFVWFLVRPQYEKVLIEERLTIISEQQRYATLAAEREIQDWFKISAYLSHLFSSRPSQFEDALKDQIGTHDEIIKITVLSLETGDELEAQNTNYPNLSYFIGFSDWIVSLNDTSLSFAWHRQDSTTVVFAVKRKMIFLKKDYVITVFFDATPVCKSLLSLPLGDEVALSLISTKNNRNEVLFQTANASKFQVSSSAVLIDETKSISYGDESWLQVARHFSVVPLTLLATIPERIILLQASSLVLFLLSFFVIVFVSLLIVGWFISAQLTKPIGELVNSVSPMQTLDFSRPIQPPHLPELNNLAETIDTMRETLDRYQKLNVEKIIFEEWKNRLFMTYSEDMIGIAAADDRFTFQNKRFAEFCIELGFGGEPPTRARFFTHPNLSIIRKSKRSEVFGTFKTELEQSEVSVLLSDSLQFFRAQTTALFSEDDVLIGSLIILHDLTRERELEKIKAETLNIVVHELRSPLNSVIGFSELLLQTHQLDEKSRRQYTTMINESGNKLLNLVNRFLNVLRLESGKVEFVKSEVNLKFIVQSLIDAFHPQLLAKSLTIQFQADESLPSVYASQELIGEAFQNLISNAIKYGDPNRTIDIELRTVSDSVVFSITDYGFGILPEFHSKLFTKFYRVKHPKSQHEVGTGLGLAYVKEIIQRHRGSILLESNDKIGCCFKVTLPISSFQKQS